MFRTGLNDGGKNGADERNRTADLLITNQLLYQLSYVGFWLALFSLPNQAARLAGGKNVLRKKSFDGRSKNLKLAIANRKHRPIVPIRATTDRGVSTAKGMILWATN
jgi:hypothetical protein